VLLVKYSHRVGIDAKCDFNEVLKSGKWDSLGSYLPTQYNHIKSYITPEALKLSERIYKQLGIELFPSIHKLHPGYWQRSSGAWLWEMMSITSFWYGSSTPAKVLLMKGVRLYEGTNGDIDASNTYGYMDKKKGEIVYRVREEEGKE
jgi:hypothetical protein